MAVSYNSLSTIIALIPAITITILVMFGKAERVVAIIRRKSTLLLLVAFCGVQIFMCVLHSPLVYRFLTSISVSILIVIFYAFEAGWPLRLLPYLRYFPK
jgi:hypothetical protein